MEIIGKVFSDQPERFTTTSSKASKYIMIVYVHHCTAIITEPLKSRADHEMARAIVPTKNKLPIFT